MKTTNEKIMNFLSTGKLKLKGTKDGLLSEKTLDKVIDYIFHYMQIEEVHFKTIDRCVLVWTENDKGIKQIIGKIEVF